MQVGFRTRIAGLTLALLLVFSAVSGFGQGIFTGSISGTVVDQQKAIVANANITATNKDTNSVVTGKTNSEGFFTLTNVPIGAYTVVIDAPTFAKLNIAGVNVSSGQTTSLGSQAMKVGASETVNVEASTPLVETSTAQIGGTFDNKAVMNLPNAGAGLDNLALYIPGVANNGSTNFSNTNGAAIANNGLRGRSNNFQIDGQSNNDNSVAGPLVFLSNQDAIQEVQIVTNNFSAEYGRNSGSVINYLTKQGSNSFHGSGFEYNTGNYSFAHTNGEKSQIFGFCPSTAVFKAGNGPGGCTNPIIPRYVENRFGFTGGGPVLKDKVFAFGSYQNDRQFAKLSSTTTTLTPTPAGLTALAAAFPGNGAVKALQTFGPYGITVGNPTPTGAVQNITVTNGVTPITVPFSGLTRVVGNNFDDKQATARGDWNASSKDRIFFRYVYQSSVFAVGSGVVSSGAYVAVPAKDRIYGGDYTRTWSSNFVTQARVSYTEGSFIFAGGDAFPQCSISGVTACPPNVAFSDSSASGVFGSGIRSFGLATNLPQDRQVHNTQYQSNETWTRGRHVIKWGGEFDHQSSPNHFLPSINGGYTFFSNNAIGVDATHPVAVAARTAFDQYLMGGGNCPAASASINGNFNGICSQLSLTQGPFNFNFKENDLAIYGQDDWRIKDNLTLNLGVRYEWDQQAINLLRPITLANVASGFWAASAPAAVTTLPHIPEDLNNFGPNIGFAYTPRIFKKLVGEDKTVIRGGYRVAYDPAFYNIFLNVATNAPVVNSGTINNVPVQQTGADVAAANLASIPKGVNPGVRNQTRVDPNLHNPYVQQYSLGIERAITSNISFETRYVGNHSVGEFQTIDQNPQICTQFTGAACTAGLAATAPQYIPAGVTPCTAAAGNAAQGTIAATPASFGRPDCNFGQVRTRNNGAWSIYNGWQNEIKVRNYHGLTTNLAYTWSKAMDNTSEIFASTGGVSTPISQNPFDPTSAERGVAAQSFKNVISLYWIYDLPFQKEQHGIIGHAIGGWQLSGTQRYQSGLMQTPLQGTGNAGYCDETFATTFVGVSSCRPLIGSSKAPFNTTGRYLNATQLIAVSNCLSTAAAVVGTPACPLIAPTDVHYILNNSFAINAICAGDPFKCTASRNDFRGQPRNQLDVTLVKNFKIREQISMQLRGDMFNVMNNQFRGTYGLTVTSRNDFGKLSGACTVTNPSCSAPGTFGNNLQSDSARRFMQIGAHVIF
jgi:outer membrane receptor protein involved in Fe transport